MLSLSLFLDPLEDGQFPTIAQEAILHASRRETVTEATLTPEGYCILLCGNTVLVWPAAKTTCSDSILSSPKRSCGEVRALKLSLPNSGLHYLLKCFVVFQQGDLGPASAMVVSPTGALRYWPELSGCAPTIDEQLPLGGEIVHSISRLTAADDKSPVFLVSTSTGVFYAVELLNRLEGDDYITQISITTLSIKDPPITSIAAGIGRRLNTMLFGTSTVKDREFVKVLPTRSQLSRADIMAITRRKVKFISIAERTLLKEVDIANLVAAYRSENLTDVAIVDVDLFRDGLLLLLACKGFESSDQGLLLGFIDSETEGNSALSSLVPIYLPDLLAADDHAANSTCVISLDTGSCVVVFPNALLHIQNPIDSSRVQASFMEGFDDHLLGCGRMADLCHLTFKSGRVCAVRQLPAGFELDFYQKYRSTQWTQGDNSIQALLENAFVAFCDKDLKLSHKLVNELLIAPRGLSDAAVDIVRVFLDRPPSSDPRWSSTIDDTNQIENIKKQLCSASRDGWLFIEQLSEKVEHFKMFLIFLHFHGLISRIDQPQEKQHFVTGRVVLTRLEEYLFAAVALAKFIYQYSQDGETNQLKVVPIAMGEVAVKFGRRFMHPASQQLSDGDYFFKEVSHFYHFLPTLLEVEERELKEAPQDLDRHTWTILEVNAAIISVLEGVQHAGSQEWSPARNDGDGAEQNQRKKSEQFYEAAVKQLNISLQFLADSLTDETEGQSPCTAMLDQCSTLAKFALSNQTKKHLASKGSSIISAFYSIGQWNLALGLAMEFHDFHLLIDHCHKHLRGKERAAELEGYKKKYEKDDFELALYDYYCRNGMVEQLLAEKNNPRLSEYLSAHEKINWIRSIEQGDYGKAKETLNAFIDDYQGSSEQKLIMLSLCKLCALCEENEDIGELAELSESIQSLMNRLQ